MNPNSLESEKEHGKKRKIDSDGFTCPNTPDTPRMPYFMHTVYKNDADIELAIPKYGKDDEGVTSEYFQHSEGSITSTECNKEDMSSDASETAATAIGNTADYNYDESGPGDTAAQYGQEKVDNYHYVSHSERHFEPNYSQDNIANEEKPKESDKPAPSFGYDGGDEQGQPDLGYYQPQGEAAGQPNASGAATASNGYDVHRYVDEALKVWKQQKDEIHEYWSGVFRLSQDYEKKALEKIALLNEKAKALDETMLQQKEAVMQRVQGIGKILELQ